MQAIPVLPSRHLGETRAFYEGLGFTTTAEHEDYLIMSAGGVPVHFWLCDDASLPQSSSCRLLVTGIERLHELYQEKGAVHPNGNLALKPWGSKEFTTLDPHGNAITLSEAQTGL